MYCVFDSQSTVIRIYIVYVVGSKSRIKQFEFRLLWRLLDEHDMVSECEKKSRLR